MQNKQNISRTPMVTILLGLHNGASFLPAQLDSIAAQTHRHWHLVCSDDRSTDCSVEIIDDFSKRHPGQVTLKQGPGRGFAANYLSLIAGLPAQPSYVSFADQDDVWLPDKLAAALSNLTKSQASLYCGRRMIWRPGYSKNTPSARCHRPFTLRNALIENVAAGNTIVLNPAAADLARRAAQRTDRIFAHDWWLYLLLTATGNTVIFDNDDPQVLYRQHADNAIGAGRGLFSQFKRKANVLRGDFAQRLDQNLHALRDIQDMLTEDARALIDDFATARNATPLTRLRHLHAIAPYRQTQRDTFGFWGAASLGLI